MSIINSNQKAERCHWLWHGVKFPACPSVSGQRLFHFWRYLPTITAATAVGAIWVTQALLEKATATIDVVNLELPS